MKKYISLIMSGFFLCMLPATGFGFDTLRSFDGVALGDSFASASRDKSLHKTSAKLDGDLTIYRSGGTCVENICFRNVEYHFFRGRLYKMVALVRKNNNLQKALLQKFGSPTQQAGSKLIWMGPGYRTILLQNSMLVYVDLPLENEIKMLKKEK